MKKHSKKIRSRLEGIMAITSKGTGYVKVEGEKEDIEVDARHLHTALHGDTVLLALHPKMHRRLSGEVVKILKRAKLDFAGVLEKNDGLFFLKPDDTKMYTDILIPPKELAGAKAGEKVFAKIISWRDPANSRSISP